MTLPSIRPYLVGREKIREFAKAVFASASIHFDLTAAQTAGYRDLVAPPTFPVVIQERALAELLALPDTGIDFSRVVYGEQAFAYERPIIAGDELIAILTVSSVKQLGGHSMVTVATEIATVAGERVGAATSTLVVRGEE